MQAEKKRAQLGARGVAEAATARSLHNTQGGNLPVLDVHLMFCKVAHVFLSGAGDVENKTRVPIAERKCDRVYRVEMANSRFLLAVPATYVPITEG